MSPVPYIALSFLVIGLLTIAVSIPLFQGKIKRNPFYGIRTPQAYESDEAWYKINRYGAVQLMVWAAVMVVLGMGAFLIPSNMTTPLVLGFGPIVVLSILFPCIQIFRYSNKL